MIATMDNPFDTLRGYLHRLGNFYYLWTTEGRVSSWAKTSNNASVPRGAKNVYFGVHPTDRIPERIDEKTHQMKKPEEVRSTLQDISSIGCVFCDYDTKDYRGSRDSMISHIRGISIKPSVVISSSANGLHSYWLLENPFAIANEADRERARNLQHRWVGFAGGDKGASDISRVLRVPGYQNFKYDPPSPVKIIFSDYSRLYTIEQLESILPQPKPRVEPKPQTFGRGYVEKALQNEAERVLSALEGARNDQLNRSSFSIGRLVASGQVSRSRAEGVLLCSALGAGLSEREALRTIQSGLKGAESK